MTFEETLHALTEAQLRTDKLLSTLVTTITQHVENSDASTKRLNEAQLRTQEAITQLATGVDKYVEAGNERMKQLEANLDGLIRAITREHSNGKERH
jgi:hypothetical protein